MNFGRTRARSKRNSLNVTVTTEKWRNIAKRISRKGTAIFEDDSDDEDPKDNEIKDWIQDFFAKKSSSIDEYEDIDVQLNKKQTLLLSTLVPDEILIMDKFHSLESKRFVGVLLMADVSGYTALSERYSNTGKGGTYRLTATLNTYLGALIEIIYTHGGDIIKFAGDAFLALWKTDNRTFLCHTIHTVIACALIIQHSYASYETDVKVNLRVKLAISAGNLIFSPIGTGSDMNYVIFGLPVLEAKAAESVCASGEVKLTPTAWGHCYTRNYDHVIHKDGYVTIKSILYDPRETDVTKPFLGFGALITPIKRPHRAVENLPNNLLQSNHKLNASDALKKSEALNLRKAILRAEGKNLGSEIRKFMIKPVLTQIYAHQPLEYLTEMRQVSILFMTLKPRECTFTQFITIVNNAYQITCEIVYKSMGCVNKIILFDKDVMILVVFGLRGYKHESEAQAALKCAQSIKKSTLTLDGVIDVSIGVTTGQVYCGVVGHPLRREFTVIGAIVNKAARLMCKFCNKITCDETTFVKSKMSANAFTLQPNTTLKGIEEAGRIYEYTEDIRVKELFNIPMTQPLLGRTDELEYYISWITENHTPHRDFDALLIVGESRVGKTRLLEWMSLSAEENGFHVCFITLSSIHSASPYLTVTQVINQILGLQEPITGFMKEQRIVQLMNAYTDDFCYLNDILKVRFAYHEGMHVQDKEKRKEKAKMMFTKLIDAISSSYIIFLDDLQNLDAESWEFISLMFCSPKIFTVLTITRGKFNAAQNWIYKVFINDSVRKIALEPLSASCIPALACQILDVKGVPQSLCNVLVMKCNGIPGEVETFLTHLFSNGALELKKIQENELIEYDQHELVFPDNTLLRFITIDPKDQEKLDEMIKADSESDIGICIVTEPDQLNINLNVQNLDVLVMIQIDSLTPYQQLLLKIASVIGNVLSRNLLENIMYENNPVTTAKGIKRLFTMRILACANVNVCQIKLSGKQESSTSQNIDNKDNLRCDCNFEYDPDNSDNLPKYAYCKIMKFKNKNSRKTCYELLPINQKKEFHSRIVNYLQNNKQKCPSCGGAIMVVQSSLCLRSFQRATSNINYQSSGSGQQKALSESDTEEDEKLNTIMKTRSESLSLDNNKIKIPKTNSEFSYKIQSDGYNKEYVKTQSNPILKNISEDFRSIDRRSTKRVTITNAIPKSCSLDSSDKSDVFDKLRELSEAAYITDWHELGVVDSQDNVKDQENFCYIKIEKNVSQINFDDCTCADLHVAIYEQLMHHALHAELKNKAIQFILSYCYLNLLGNNVEVVFPKLEVAEKMCHDNKQILNDLDYKIYLGKIFSLLTSASVMTGRLTVAKMHLASALKIYRININKGGYFLHVKNIINAIQKKRGKHRALLLKSDVVYCLNVATLLYSMLKENKLARVAAFKAIVTVQSVECSVMDMCDAYGNALQVELDRDMPESTGAIEKMACQSLQKLQNPIQLNELLSVGRFFMGTFRARISRGELASAIRSGYRVLTISRFLQAYEVSLDLIPELFYALLSRRRIAEAIDVLLLLSRLWKPSQSYDYEVWYYALNMDMILDAGFQLESPLEITSFAEYSLVKGSSGGAGRRRLVVNLWTYWLRTNSEKRARKFEREALSWVATEDDGSMTSLISAMRLAEGMLESLARKVNDLRKVVDIMELRSIAERELNRLESDAFVLRTIYPRWMLLRGYTLKLTGRQSASVHIINQAMDEAHRIHNHLEESLARAACSRSVRWSESALTNTFPQWREGAECAKNAWHQLMYQITSTRLDFQSSLL